MPTITFRNLNQKVLYECELKGQISDGHWENARPEDHWIVMTDAEVEVNPEKVGCSFHPRRRYNFAAKDLLDVVEDRMLFYVRAVMAYPKLANEIEAHNYWKQAMTERQWMKVVKMPYSHRDLIRDLKDMSKIVNEHCL